MNSNDHAETSTLANPVRYNVLTINNTLSQIVLKKKDTSAPSYEELCALIREFVPIFIELTKDYPILRSVLTNHLIDVWKNKKFSESCIEKITRCFLRGKTLSYRYRLAHRFLQRELHKLGYKLNIYPPLTYPKYQAVKNNLINEPVNESGSNTKSYSDSDTEESDVENTEDSEEDVPIIHESKEEWEEFLRNVGLAKSLDEKIRSCDSEIEELQNEVNEIKNKLNNLTLQTQQLQDLKNKADKRRIELEHYLEDLNNKADKRRAELELHIECVKRIKADNSRFKEEIDKITGVD